MLSPFVDDQDFTLHVGDALALLRELPHASVDCCVTSPPYWGLRDYGHVGQIGLEASPEEYVATMVAVFREVRRVLVDDGTLWLNLGDSYNNRSCARRSSHQGGLGFESEDLSKTWARMTKEGHTRLSISDGDLKEKDMVGIPWMTAFALRSDGWYLRSEIIWAKPNPMPSSAKDRPACAHERVFLLAKSHRYYYDGDSIAEPAEWARWGDQSTPKHNGTATGSGWIQPKTKAELRSGRVGAYQRRAINGEGDGTTPTHALEEPRLTRNARSVWTIPTKGLPEAHFAVFPEELARRCILAGCPEGGTVLDPFMGSGTTALVARAHGRKAVGIELNAGYARLAAKRLQQLSLLA